MATFEDLKKLKPALESATSLKEQANIIKQAHPDEFEMYDDNGKFIIKNIKTGEEVEGPAHGMPFLEKAGNWIAQHGFGSGVGGGNPDIPEGEYFGQDVEGLLPTGQKMVASGYGALRGQQAGAPFGPWGRLAGAIGGAALGAGGVDIGQQAVENVSNEAIRVNKAVPKDKGMVDTAVETVKGMETPKGIDLGHAGKEALIYGLGEGFGNLVLNPLLHNAGAIYDAVLSKKIPAIGSAVKKAGSDILNLSHLKTPMTPPPVIGSLGEVVDSAGAQNIKAQNAELVKSAFGKKSFQNPNIEEGLATKAVPANSEEAVMNKALKTAIETADKNAKLTFKKIYERYDKAGQMVGYNPATPQFFPNGSNQAGLPSLIERLTDLEASAGTDLGKKKISQMITALNDKKIKNLKGLLEFRKSSQYDDILDVVDPDAIKDLLPVKKEIAQDVHDMIQEIQSSVINLENSASGMTVEDLAAHRMARDTVRNQSPIIAAHKFGKWRNQMQETQRLAIVFKQNMPKQVKEYADAMRSATREGWSQINHDYSDYIDGLKELMKRIDSGKSMSGLRTPKIFTPALKESAIEGKLGATVSDNAKINELLLRKNLLDLGTEATQGGNIKYDVLDDFLRSAEKGGLVHEQLESIGTAEARALSERLKGIEQIAREPMMHPSAVPAKPSLLRKTGQVVGGGILNFAPAIGPLTQASYNPYGTVGRKLAEMLAGTKKPEAKKKGGN